MTRYKVRGIWAICPECGTEYNRSLSSVPSVCFCQRENESAYPSPDIIIERKNGPEFYDIKTANKDVFSPAGKSDSGNFVNDCVLMRGATIASKVIGICLWIFFLVWLIGMAFIFWVVANGYLDRV